MNDTELRQRQLARLKGELVEPIDEIPTESTLKEYVPDPEVLAELNIQPSNEIESEPFVVGYRRNQYGDLLALPAAKWPNPGQPKTPDISRVHAAEEHLVGDANCALTDCVRWLAGKIRNPDDWDNPYCGTPSQMYEASWKFLTGVWRARNLDEPSESQMQRWAKEYVATTRRPREGTCKEDSKSPSD